MNPPRVSIITPNFNKGTFVSDCISSVLSQTFTDWEMLFVDDGSTDGSDILAERAAAGDGRIRFYRNSPGTKGASHARNLGLERSRGDLVLFLDSDDLLHPQCLERRVQAMDGATELGYIVFPTAIFMREPGDSDFICNVPTEEPPLHRFLNRDIVWLISGPIWRREVLDGLEGFDPELHSQQDFDLHVRALIEGVPYEYRHLEPMVYYRQEVDSLPRKNSQSTAHFEARFDMVTRHCELMREKNLLDRPIKQLLARYLLDLAQMMRWHIDELGNAEALKSAERYWQRARKLELVDESAYKLGRKYIRFKHTMLYNRFPRWKHRREQKFRRLLNGLIFRPSKRYCRVKMDDYAG